MTAPTELRETQTTHGEFPGHELAAWAAELGVVAGITDRGADFGLSSEEPTKQVLDRWRRFRATLRPAFPTVVVARQCHGTRLAIHRDALSGWRIEDDYDGHLSCQTGVLLTVTVADCVPVYLAQQAGPGVGLLHAGWRGIASGMIEHGIAAFCELTKCSAADVIIHCGVSICGDCYEVGPEVHQAVTGQPASANRRLDLRASIVRRAGRVGVARATSSPWCSAHDRKQFYSHRASGGLDGRMLAFLGRPSP